MNKTILVLVCLLLIGSAWMIWLELSPNQPVGSVTGGNEYNATSTSAGGSLRVANPFLIKSGWGTFGSVVITKAGASGGYVNFYNATTTNVLLRTGNIATTSIIMVSYPTDLAAGTYVFDAVFTTGLIMDYVPNSTAIGTSTILYR